MFKNIVVTFVTHKIKERPFFVGLTLAKVFNGNMMVIECVYRKQPRFVFFETKNDKKAVAKQRIIAQKSLEKFTHLAKESNVPIKTKVALTDSISDWVIDYVKENRTDLLIIDHPHMSEFEETYYDDIIQSISHAVKVPILLLRS